MPLPAGLPGTQPPRRPLRAMEPELEAQEQSRPRRRSRRASGLNAGGAAEPAADTPGPGPDGRYSLRRGSSFTFLTPGPHWDFTLKRKRREKDDDVVSLSSLDLKTLRVPAILRILHWTLERRLYTNRKQEPLTASYLHRLQ